MKTKLLFFVLGFIAAIVGYWLFQMGKAASRPKVEAKEVVWSPTALAGVKVLKDSFPITYQDTTRTLYFYLPSNYHADTLARYPVIYMLDGESCCDNAANESTEWQMDEVIEHSLVAGGPAAIVVGIEQAPKRDPEYTPWPVEDYPNAHGEAFVNWLAEELKPWVDTTFRTNPSPSATTIGGISRSGMMAYYALLARPDAFERALIQSPAMWVDRDKLMAMPVPESIQQKAKVFVSVGQNEGGIMVPDAKAIYERFAEFGLPADRLRYEVIPNEGHWHMTWRKSFAAAYPWIVE
ncbi:MAG: alpha/beta hydrolase-fold protein [Bacteroidota bacterium]